VLFVIKVEHPINVLAGRVHCQLPEAHLLCYRDDLIKQAV
jgi:hypothetical protein